MASLSCGQYHTAACTLDGELFAWGANGDGQLGLDGADRRQPCRVHNDTSSGMLQVACGGRHTLVLGGRGEVWSCGANAHGQVWAVVPSSPLPCRS